MFCLKRISDDENATMSFAASILPVVPDGVMLPTASDVVILTFDVFTVIVVPSSLMLESPKELPPPVNFVI